MINLTRSILLSLFLVFGMSTAAAAYDGKATVECGDVSLDADVADVQVAKDGSSMQIELRSHDALDALVTLDVTLAGHEGQIRPRHVANVSVAIRCPEAEYTIERPAVEGVRDHADFQVLDILFAKDGQFEMHVWARNDDQPELSWNVEVTGSFSTDE